MVIDGHEHPESLIDMVMSTQQTSNQNNVIKFNDNSRLVSWFNIIGLRKYFLTIETDSVTVNSIDGSMNIAFIP